MNRLHSTVFFVILQVGLNVKDKKDVRSRVPLDEQMLHDLGKNVFVVKGSGFSVFVSYYIR